MTHASLFSGIGGAEIAAVWMGWQNLFHCEIEEFPRRVLDYWFPNAESYEDIRKTNFKKWGGKVDVLTGGFPCQPFSVAGRREGEKDNRYLWQEMYRAIQEINPTWIVGENVAGITTMVESSKTTYLGRKTNLFDESDLYREESIFTLERICQDLENIGYEVQPLIIPACAVGHHIDETGCGLLPTVQTQGLKKCNNKTGRTEFYPLSLLPTPTALDKGGGRMNRSLSVNSSDRPTLALAAQMKLLPTPNASEGVKYTTTYNQHSQMGRSLTAMAINGMLGTKIDRKKDGIPFHLNPLYVADMMGYPSMWTVLPFLSQNGDKSQ